jgi:hypothetical protein
MATSSRWCGGADGPAFDRARLAQERAQMMQWLQAAEAARDQQQARLAEAWARHRALQDRLEERARARLGAHRR